MNTETKKKAGRPPVTIVWPDGSFTVEQLNVATKISKVTLYLKVKEALATQVLEKCGKEKVKSGRPKILLRKVAVASTPVVPVPTPAPTVPDVATPEVVSVVAPETIPTPEPTLVESVPVAV